MYEFVEFLTISASDQAGCNIVGLSFNNSIEKIY
jgi:hypothetical protein